MSVTENTSEKVVAYLSSTISDLLLSLHDGLKRNRFDLCWKDSTSTYSLNNTTRRLFLIFNARSLIVCDHMLVAYLRVLKKSGDASDVQAEASRSASCSVNTGSEERVVLLPRGHTSRAH